MNSRERIFAAFDLEEPDRVPVFDWGFLDNLSNFRNVENVLGRTIWAKFNQASFSARASPEILDALIECCIRVGLDMTAPHLTSLPPKETSRTGLPKDILLDEWGMKWHLDIDFSGNPRTWYDGPAVENVEDLDSYIMPDPYEQGRMEAIRYFVKKAKEKGLVPAGTISSGAIGLILSIEKTALAFYKNPEALERYMDRLFKYCSEIGKAEIDGVEIIIGGYEIMLFCDRKGPMVNPKMLRKYVFPRLQNYVSDLKKHGLQFYVAHIDGNCTQLLDDFINIGFDAIHPIERPSMDLGYVKERWGDKICIMGNVDCGETLVHGTVIDVQREVRECIAAAAKGGGYILSSSDSLHGGVKTENFITMVKSTHKYGVYPIK
ncbi:MAG: uroporphyrinogen decarboxylase family protein [Candidatus Bathyarchaeia archaeon]